MANYSEELDLVELAQKGDKAAAHKLWDIYTPLVYKKYYELLTSSKDNNISINISKDEYVGDAYIKFINQLSGIRIDDLRKNGYGVTKPWKLYCRLEGYLRSMNRDKRNHSVKISSNECEIKQFYESDLTNIDLCKSYTENYETKLKSEIFMKSWLEFEKRLNANQKRLFEAQQRFENTKSGKPNYKVLTQELGLSKKEIEKGLAEIKQVFSATLAAVSKKSGFELSYSDFLE